MVIVSVDNRDALFTETGTVYGPPATRNSLPGGVTMICAAGVVAAPGVAGAGAFGSRGGALGSVTGGGVVAPAGGGGNVGRSVAGPIGAGTGDVPGGTG